MNDNSVIGKSVRRSDVLEKVTGEAKYVADIALPGLLHACSKRSKIAHALIRRIDTSRALALPGVKAVLTHENVPRVLHAGSPHPRSASVTPDQYILDRKVRYWGETVAVVAAVTPEIAEEALELIEVEYEELPAVFTVEDAMRPDAPQIHDRGLDCNQVLPPVRVSRGDAERGFAEADVIIEGEYECGRPTPAYMEPNVCTCQWDANDNLTVWISTQTSFMVRGIMAEVLGLPWHKVRVLCDHMGGGFGAKQDLFQSEFLCALLARQTRRPVRLEYTREETFLGGRSRHPAKIWLKQGFKKDGTITARQARMIFNSGAYGSHGPGVTNVGTNGFTSLYRCENVELEGRCIYTNSPIAGAFRGFGVLQATYALDIQMDEAAEKLGMDPAQLKLMNAVRDGDYAPSGHPVDGNGLPDCIRRGMQEVGWDELRRRPRDTGVHRRGWGLGCEMHGSGAQPAIKEQGNATVKMNEDGSIVLFTGAANLGTGSHSTLAQIVAEELGVTFESIGVVRGDTDVVPWDIGAFASHTTSVAGRAAQMAAADVKRQLLRHAADQLEVSADDLDILQGVIRVRGTDRTLSIHDAVAPKRGIPSLQFIAHATNVPHKAYSFAAHFVEVSVDTETGQISVLQVVPVHEIGKVINPIAAAGQIEGGIQQGIGHTLYEDHQIDLKTGRSLNANFVDYKMPLSMDMPSIRTVIIETAPDAEGPFGAKGVGEDPIVAIGPAIANAVYDAIGVRFRHYPIKPEQVLQALRAKEAAARSTTEKRSASMNHHETARRPVPVTILTGFLGAGKTTLLNHILTEKHGHRIAVIENEFGEVDVDSDLVMANSDEEIFQIVNGCICCTVDVRNDLVKTLQMLLERPEQFDHILVETSGLADPTPVAATFFMDNEVARQVVLDGVVTLVDAMHVQPHLDDPALAEHDNQAVQQIVVADRILLNKTDLVAPAQLADLEGRIRTLNCNAPILRTVQARVDLSQILGLQAFECDALASTDPNFLDSHDDHHHAHVCDEHCHHEHGAHDEHHHGHARHSHDVAAMLAPHSHDPSVGSVSLLFDQPFDTERLMQSLNALLAVDGDDIYRVKGILHARGDDRRHVLQGVHRLLELKPSIPWWDEKPGSKLVFIGRRLNAEALRERLAACTVVHAPVSQEAPEAA